jgi:hypothetical protein
MRNTLPVSRLTLVEPSNFADARRKPGHVFVRNLLVPCSICIHRHERHAGQRMRINFDPAVSKGDRPIDDIRNIICSEQRTRGRNGSATRAASTWSSQ